MDKCHQWKQNPSINPETGRVIKIHGPTWKRLNLDCNITEECTEWRINPTVNPTSRRRIKRDGPTFNRFSVLCKQNVDLNRFILAQHDTYLHAINEIKIGKKTGHWIWYIFPQLASLGKSEKAKYYGIVNLDEAISYINHPILGKRYIDCINALLDLSGKTASQIFGSDSVKVLSSLTLFYIASTNIKIGLVINKYYNGRLDVITEHLLHE